jgi:pyruvate formate lyase activating enzyme
LDNLRALGEIHPNIWIRVPVIPGLNDDDEHVERVARLALTTPGVRQINLIPYHRSGMAKFRRLGKTYALENIPNPSDEQLERMRDKLSSFGLTAVMGG